MSEPELTALKATPQRAFRFATAFYWRLILGFLFLSWAVDVFLMFSGLLGGGQALAAVGVDPFWGGVVFDALLFAGAIYGVLYIVLGSPLGDFAVVLSSGKGAAATELDNAVGNVLPVWMSVSVKIVPAFLLIGFAVGLVQAFNLDANGLPKAPWLQSNLAAAAITIMCLYPVTFLSLSGVMNKDFKRLRTLVVEMD